MRDDLPTGTVTFLFTDVEGSTKLLHELGAEGYAGALAEHRRVLREAFHAHRGVEVDTQGDAFFVAFPTAPGAVAAAGEMTEALASGPIQVRVGLHTGTPLLTEEGYVGEDVHKGARIAAAAHGGQVLVSASTASLVASGLHELGEHRLKDLSAPERIYQLGEGEFPPLKSLYRTNLPVPATAFLGREAELAEVGALLARKDVRLLTLTGPGGTGKTRLALQAVAAASDDYPDGVFWVPLAPLRDPALVLEEASQAVGAKDGLAEHLADKLLLLLFDNFEHVVDAATGLADLLAACPNLGLVVTSRELLQLPGEQAYPVPPLAEEDGVELFTVRARASRPGFTPSPDHAGALRVARQPATRARAGGGAGARPKPRAAARASRRQARPAQGGAWCRSSPTDPARHHRMELRPSDGGRASASLLGSQSSAAAARSKRLKRSQTPISTPFSPSSTRAFCVTTRSATGCSRRSGSSRPSSSRSQAKAEDLRRRHADFILALATEAEPHLRKESQEWIDRLEREQDNVRAALDWLEAMGESEVVLELTAAVWWAWSLRGPIEEGRRRVESALEGDLRPTGARASALIGALDFAVGDGDNLTAILRAEEALELLRMFGDTWGIAYTLLGLGLAYAGESAWPEAQRNFEESVRLFEELGDEHEAMQSARRLAWSYEELGDLDRARRLHEHNVRRARETGDEFIEARSLAVLATYALDEGRIDEAIPMLERSDRIHSTRPDLPDRWAHAINLCRFARALAIRGDNPTAAVLLPASRQRRNKWA